MIGRYRPSPAVAAVVAMTIAAGILARIPGATAARNCEALPAAPRMG
jgi:hypothetical protein